MECEAHSLIEEATDVAGVRARTADGEVEFRTKLVVAADGRQSVLRQQSGLEIVELGAPMDALWFRLSRRTRRHRPEPGAVRGRRRYS